MAIIPFIQRSLFEQQKKIEKEEEKLMANFVPDWGKAEKKVARKRLRRKMARLRGGRPRSHVSDSEIRNKAFELDPYCKSLFQKS